VSQYRFLSFTFLAAAALAALPACSVRYRHDVEKSGTPANYTYSAGGFMRYDGYDDVAGDMEVASREYVKPGSGTRIRLVGAIHIGDLDYYRALQKEALDTADVVLFEGVKFEGDKPPPDLGGVYSSIGTLLGIGFQKDGINYKAKNFVHCDITVKDGDPLFQTIDPEQIDQAAQMLQPLAMMKGMLGPNARQVEDALKHGMVTMMAMQMGGDDDAGPSEAEREKALSKLGARGQDDPLRKSAEKALEQLKKTGGLQLPGMSDGMKKEVLERRNRYVLDRLKERLDADGDAKRQTVAVFYGAAHLPGMEKEIEGWGYKPVETVWFKAWRMNGRGKPVLSERVAMDGSAPADRRSLRAPGAKQPTLF
jgi:hypothetical protein